jgi:hypothetical protein
MKTLRIQTYVIALLTALIVGFNGYAQSNNVSKHANLRILLIGNSFSQNASTYLPQLAKEGGHDLIIGHAEIGGCSLQKHWELAELNKTEPDNPKGKPYVGNKSLRMLLTEGEWDVVTMQQYSGLSGNVESYKPYAGNLYKLIRQLQPHARILLHQTWAYRSDSKSFGEVAPGKPAKTEKEMYEKSREAYHQIAGELKIDIIPTGDAFWLVSSDQRSAYRKDENFNPKTAVYPALPIQTNSLNVGYTWVNDQLNLDTHHANDSGKYLGSLVWYAILFKESVQQVKFKPDDISAEFEYQLKAAAQKAITIVEYN